MTLPGANDDEGSAAGFDLDGMRLAVRTALSEGGASDTLELRVPDAPSGAPATARAVAAGPADARGDVAMARVTEGDVDLGVPVRAERAAPAKRQQLTSVVS